MVGFALEEAERLCIVFEQLGARARLFDASEPPDSDAIRLRQAADVDVREETLGSAWLDPACAVSRIAAVVMVGSRDLIMALGPDVQARAQEFLIDGWQPEEALMRLAFALSRVAPAPEKARVIVSSARSNRPVALSQARILIADDDAAVSAVLQKTLRDHAVDCRAAGSGEEALRMIDDERHVLVLDVNMPAISGFEVLSAIGRLGLPVRVVMLSARRQERDIIQGFNLGADDYIVKPFSPMELMVRIKRFLNS